MACRAGRGVSIPNTYTGCVMTLAGSLLVPGGDARLIVNRRRSDTRSRNRDATAKFLAERMGRTLIVNQLNPAALWLPDGQITREGVQRIEGPVEVDKTGTRTRTSPPPLVTAGRGNAGCRRCRRPGVIHAIVGRPVGSAKNECYAVFDSVIDGAVIERAGTVIRTGYSFRPG